MRNTRSEYFTSGVLSTTDIVRTSGNDRIVPGADNGGHKTNGGSGTPDPPPGTLSQRGNVPLLLRAHSSSPEHVRRRRHEGRAEYCLIVDRILNQRCCVRREKEALADSLIRRSRYNADIAGVGTVPLLK